MTIDNINVEESMQRVTTLIAAEQDLSPALKSSLEVLLVLVRLLLNRLGLNSKNSSKPPLPTPSGERSLVQRVVASPAGSQGMLEPP